MPQAARPDWRETILAGSRTNGSCQTEIASTRPLGKTADPVHALATQVWIRAARNDIAMRISSPGPGQLLERYPNWLVSSLRIFWPWYADSHPNVRI